MGIPNRRLGFYKLLSKQKSLKAFVALLGIIAASPASAQQEPSSVRPYQPRVETNIRAGTERTILMTEAWVPLAQDNGRVVYGDVRLMGDDGDNREWNFGIGYREMNAQADAAFGLHGWFDRRRSSRGSVFHQVAGGVEYLSGDLDVRLNGYIPFNEEERYTIAGGSTTPYLADTGIFYDTNGLLVEKPLHGFDVEFSLPVKALENTFDSFRVSAGGFVFSGDDVETLRGVRLRAAADVTSDLQIGARFETDNQRGAQAFAEATLRFPFGSKASNRTLGLRSRLDESPERDIDIITSAKVAVAATQRNAVTSSFDGLEQRVFHVDNTAAAGGDGSLSNPFNTLAAANAAANRPGDVIYLNRGDGTTAGQNQGVTLAHQGQALIGSGVDFVYDGTRFTAGAGANFSGTVLRAASTAPVITNTGGNGVLISAGDTLLAGVDITSTAGHGVSYVSASGVDLGLLTLRSLSITDSIGDGIRIEAAGVGSFVNAELSQVTASFNTNGIRFYAHANGSVAGTIEASSVTYNTQYGVIAYDDSNIGSVDLDLGGGGRSSGLNAFYSNVLEEISVDLDGETLMARNNWWGQASGLYQNAPSGSLRPQIYYGAPVNDSLVGHWTFDQEWMSNSIAFDRSGNSFNGSMQDDLDLSNIASGRMRQSLAFEGMNTSGIDLGNNPQLNPSGSFTILAFYNRNTTGSYNYLYSNSRDCCGVYDGIDLVDNGAYRIRLWDDVRSDIAMTGATVSGTWYHVATTVEGTSISHYINGALNRTAVSAVSLGQPATFNTYIGSMGFANGNRYTMNGYIDDVRLYSRALSPGEISEIYRSNSSSSVDASASLSEAPLR